MTAAQDWTGRVGDVWAAEWRRTDRSLADLSRHLDAAIAAAAPAGRFRAFDIGCGAGATSLALAKARPDAEIIAVDLSDPLVAVAKQRANVLPSLDREGSGVGRLPQAHPSKEDNTAPTPPLPGRGAANLSFLPGDALNLATEHAPFDLLYSRHGVMFFADPVAAFTTLRRSAAPGARIVFTCFRDWTANAFTADPLAALDLPPPQTGPGPFAFADRDRVAAVLTAAGWRDSTATPIDFTYRAGAGPDPIGDALDFLQRIGPAASALRGMADGERAEAIDRLRGVIERYRVADTVDFPAAAWLWSATA